MRKGKSKIMVGEGGNEREREGARESWEIPFVFITKNSFKKTKQKRKWKVFYNKKRYKNARKDKNNNKLLALFWLFLPQVWYHYGLHHP